MEFGTVATVVTALFKATNRPPAGAGPVSITVPVTVSLPPTSDTGLTATEEMEGGLIPRLAVDLKEPWLAEIIADTFEETALVEILNVAEVAPKGTLTVVGAEAELALDDRLILIPALGAGPERVTVPVAAEPP
jgi:hypothetical protein